MTKGRLEAFSDGVIAIIITIMVLELKVPHEHGLEGLRPMAPTFASYALSFVFVGIYWNNHHHLFQAVRKVTGAVLWANLGLLFFLSLVPFGTAWMGESHFESGPVAFYGVIFLLAGVGYTMLAQVLLAAHGEDSALRQALGNDLKGKLSLALYLAAVPLAFYVPLASCAIYVTVAIIWLVPDRRIERTLAGNPHHAE
ncbi:MAG TPA: TMEM175 family protein [Myxococcales bacterium]|jgi:uncharacterized membrane protein|nr:TMEM175 family protein [Myxococcales bacterium]